MVWKNLLMHPVFGLFAWLMTSVGLQPIDWFTDFPMTAIFIIVAWQWLPFATLILLTALQSLDEEQKEAAEMDGAGAIPTFIYITLPHLARPITVVILIETIFLLTVFAEIYVTTSGGPGTQTTNLAFLIYTVALKNYDVGRRFRRWPARGGARQHRGLLPGPHRRQESGGLSHGTPHHQHQRRRHYRRRPGQWGSSSSSDPLDDAHQLQERARRLLDAAEISCSSTGPRKTTPSSSSAAITSCTQ